MCARYDSSVEIEVVHSMLGFDLTPSASLWKPKGDTFPDMPALVAARFGGVGSLVVGSWGWTRPGSKKGAFNIRSETADTMAFWSEGRYQRCAILARCWYEWLPNPDPTSKKAGPLHRISTPASPILFLLGVWRVYKERMEVSMLMHESPPELMPFHDRMPLPVSPEDAVAWTSSTDPIRDWAASDRLLRAEAVPA